MSLVSVSKEVTMAKPAAVLLVLVVSASPALADVTGEYNVKFEELSSNCTSPLHYTHGKLAIKIKGNTLTVDVDRTPLMSGIPPKTGGKISAKSKSGNTMIEGMKGVFSVAGKVSPEGLIDLMMIGEYTANGKPLCTQAWRVTGPRSDRKSSARKPAAGSRAAAPHRSERQPVMGDLVHLARFGR
jgi:hypothetical protein